MTDEQKLIVLLRKAREQLDSVVDCGASGGGVCSVCLKRAAQVRDEIDKALS